MGVLQQFWRRCPGGGSGGVQIQDSDVGTTEELTFTPNNPSASVEIESFSFDAYYNDNERFTYSVSVVSGTTVLSGPTMYTYLSDGTKNHPVVINCAGAPGQTLKLRLLRVPSTLASGEVEGSAYNNAVDDIAFAQSPATTFPAGPQVVSVTPADDTSGLPATSAPAYAAIIADGPSLTAAAPFQLKLDGNPVSPPPTVTPLGGGQTSVSYPGADLRVVDQRFPCVHAHLCRQLRWDVHEPSGVQYGLYNAARNLCAASRLRRSERLHLSLGFCQLAGQLAGGLG